MVTYYDSFVGFRLFQLVSLNIRWAPVASRPSVGYNWAWHLWDMSSTSAFSHSVSLCVYFSVFLPAWGWGHLVYVGGARQADWRWCGPDKSMTGTQLVLYIALFWPQSLVDHPQQNILHLEHSSFTLVQTSCTVAWGVASWIKLSYQNISGEIIHFCQPPSLVEGEEEEEEEEEEIDTGDWEATVRTCQKKWEGFSGPWTHWL